MCHLPSRLKCALKVPLQPSRAIQSEDPSVGSSRLEQLIVGFANGTTHSPSTAQKRCAGIFIDTWPGAKSTGPAQSGW